MRKAFLVAVCLFLVCLTSAAFADTSGPYVSNTIAYELTDWTHALELPKFDASLGTLNSIDLILSGSTNSVLTVTNYGSKVAKGSTHSTVTLSITDPQSLLNLDLNIASSDFKFSNLASGASQTSNILLGSGSAQASYTSQNILDEFTGTGTISLPTSTETETSLTYSGGNTLASQATNASAFAKVIYHYSAVPEPSSIIALLTGGVGLLGLLRRRK